MLTVRVYPRGKRFLSNVWEVPADGTSPMLLCTIVKTNPISMFDTPEEAREAGEEYICGTTS